MTVKEKSNSAFDFGLYKLKQRLKLVGPSETGELFHCKFSRPIIAKDGEFEYRDPYMVATCGMNSVSWVDCSTGNVVSRYTHVDADENLTCLDWGYLYNMDDQGNEIGPISVVASGGALGVIHLLNVHQRECYAFLEGHSDTVTDVKFMPKTYNRLLSSSEDGTLRMWQLGFPTDGEHTLNSCIMVFQGAYYRINAFDIDDMEKFIYAGCDQKTEKDEAGAISIFEIPKMEKSQQSAYTSEKIAVKVVASPIATFHDENFHDSHVDSVICLSDGLIASKGAFDDSINIWKLVFKRNSLEKKRIAQYDRLIEFERPNPDSLLYVSKMTVIEQINYTLLVEGRTDGTLAFYYVPKGEGKIARKSTVADYEYRYHKPRAIVRGMAASHDGRFIVSVDADQFVDIYENESA